MVRLTKAVRVRGQVEPAGSIHTLPLEWEAELVRHQLAEYHGHPDLPSWPTTTPGHRDDHLQRLTTR